MSRSMDIVVGAAVASASIGLVVVGTCPPWTHVATAGTEKVVPVPTRDPVKYAAKFLDLTRAQDSTRREMDSLASQKQVSK